MLVKYTLCQITIAEDTLQSQAKDLAERWLSLAQSSDGERLLGQYGNESSSAMLYNIYADLLLGTQLIDQDVSLPCTRRKRWCPTMMTSHDLP